MPEIATSRNIAWTRLLIACLVIVGLLPVVAAQTGARAAAPVQAHQGQFFPLTPARFLNTSTGQGVVGGVSGTIGAGATKNVVVLGSGGVPASGVSAVVFSLTVASPSTTTLETVWPAGATRPGIASLAAPHLQVTSTVTSALGTSGQISIYNSARANRALDDAMQSDPAFADSMEQLIPGVSDSVSSVGGRATPEGWTWHHAPTSAVDGRVGVMQLVPSFMHEPGSMWQGLFHPGGFGGYSEWAIPKGAP